MPIPKKTKQTYSRASLLEDVDIVVSGVGGVAMTASANQPTRQRRQPLHETDVPLPVFTDGLMVAPFPKARRAYAARKAGATRVTVLDRSREWRRSRKEAKRPTTTGVGSTQRPSDHSFLSSTDSNEPEIRVEPYHNDANFPRVQVEQDSILTNPSRPVLLEARIVDEETQVEVYTAEPIRGSRNNNNKYLIKLSLILGCFLMIGITAGIVIATQIGGESQSPSGPTGATTIPTAVPLPTLSPTTFTPEQEPGPNKVPSGTTTGNIFSTPTPTIPTPVPAQMEAPSATTSVSFIGNNSSGSSTGNISFISGSTMVPTNETWTPTLEDSPGTPGPTMSPTFQTPVPTQTEVPSMPPSASPTIVFVEAFGRTYRLSTKSIVLPGVFGSLPSQLGRLTALTELNLDGNRLTGTIPTEFGQLTALTKLNLNGDIYDERLNGTIPSEIGLITALEELDLSWNRRLVGSLPTEIGHLTALTKLDLLYNGFSGNLPTEMGYLTALVYLDVSRNIMTGQIPSEIGQQTMLVNLGLVGNLEGVHFSGKIPTELAQLTALTVLTMGYNQLTGTIMSELGLLTDLTHHNLQQNRLSGNIPTEYGQFTAVTQLYLGNNQFTGTLPSELGQLSSTGVLMAFDNLLTGVIPSQIGKLSAMWQLGLSRNRLRGTIPTELGQLTSLSYALDLSFNELFGSIPSEFGQITDLQSWSIHQNQLTGELPTELGQLTALSWLSLNQNGFEGSIPSEVCLISSLSNLVVGCNSFLSDLLCDCGPQCKCTRRE